MHKIDIIGYSGHSYVCIEVALLNNIKIESYYDKFEKSNNPFKLNYLGKESNLNSVNKTFICIADNKIRKDIYTSLTKYY